MIRPAYDEFRQWETNRRARISDLETGFLVCLDACLWHGRLGRVENVTTKAVFETLPEPPA